MKTQVPIVLGSFVLAALLQTASAQNIIFDNFEVDEGHFNLSPGFSGSSVGETNITADRVTTDGPFEGIGHQKLVLDHDATTTAIRIRHLSGGGTPANNVAFSTSGGDDGWIGFYLKNDPGHNWTAQLWIEGVSINGGIPKNVIADGAWHVYEWNLDDNSGGPDGWGTISGIIAGVATVSDGSHTIDSIVLRNGTTPSSSSTIFLDFVAKSASGSIRGLVTPFPPTLRIFRAAPGQATVSWTPATAGFVLQESLSLSPAAWTNSVSGATNPIVVPANLPTKFYRLIKP